MEVCILQLFKLILNMLPVKLQPFCCYKYHLNFKSVQRRCILDVNATTVRPHLLLLKVTTPTNNSPQLSTIQTETFHTGLIFLTKRFDGVQVQSEATTLTYNSNTFFIIEVRFLAVIAILHTVVVVVVPYY